MSQIQTGNIPPKFLDAAGTVNAAALAQSLTQLGGDPSQFIQGTGIDVNGMAGAYRALEAAATKKIADEKPTDDAATLNIVSPENPAQLDWAAATQEILTSGDLSVATRQAFTKAGVPDSAINGQIAGIKAQQEVSVRRLADSIGGMGEYNAFIEWANTAMTVDQRQGLFAQMSQPGGEYALQGAFAQYKNAIPAAGVANAAGIRVGNEPALFNTSGSGAANTDPGLANAPFTDVAERHAAFADPRYRTDRGFREIVEGRARATAQHMNGLRIQGQQQ